MWWCPVTAAAQMISDEVSQHDFYLAQVLSLTVYDSSHWASTGQHLSEVKHQIKHQRWCTKNMLWFWLRWEVCKVVWPGAAAALGQLHKVLHNNNTTCFISLRRERDEQWAEAENDEWLMAPPHHHHYQLSSSLRKESKWDELSLDPPLPVMS